MPAEYGRYYGKGMRIDYVLVHEALAHRVRRAVVLGSGAERSGFLGSDHCPLLVELAPAADAPAAAPGATGGGAAAAVASGSADASGGADGARAGSAGTSS